MSQVSILILNYNHPEVIDVCLNRLTMTEGVGYEVIVIDNGSDAETLEALHTHSDHGRMDALVPLGENRLYSGGYNAGVKYADPAAEYLLFLNSDVAVLRPDWLAKLVAWIEGRAVAAPSAWCTRPPDVRPGPLDVLSAGWSYDELVEPGHVRPEGFCLMMRQSVWRPFDENFPWHYGWEHTVAEIVRDGGRCGVLFNYAPYFIHRECASGRPNVEIVNRDFPDLPGWFRGLEIETLDFSLGPDEHSTYMNW